MKKNYYKKLINKSKFLILDNTYKELKNGLY